MLIRNANRLFAFRNAEEHYLGTLSASCFDSYCLGRVIFDKEEAYKSVYQECRCLSWNFSSLEIDAGSGDCIASGLKKSKHIRGTLHWWREYYTLTPGGTFIRHSRSYPSVACFYRDYYDCIREFTEEQWRIISVLRDLKVADLMVSKQIGNNKAIWDKIVKRDWSGLQDKFPNLAGELTLCVFNEAAKEAA